MARLIGSKLSDNYGEKVFLEKAAEYLDDSHIIYWNRDVSGREFDACILLPDKGLLVVEVKGWKEESVVGIENSDTILLQTQEGVVASRPQKQARGYRYALEKRIRNGTGKFPLVFSMVCLPQITRESYKRLRLDVLLEEPFTILQQDLENKAAFVNKLNQALVLAKKWDRMPFDPKTMLEVRSLFESDIDLGAPQAQDVVLNRYDPVVDDPRYSHFYYIGRETADADRLMERMVAQYGAGAKLYAVFEEKDRLVQVARAVDSLLERRGLVRNRESLALAFAANAGSTPSIIPGADTFTAFQCSLSALSHPVDGLPNWFHIPDGELNPEQKEWLQALAQCSHFNDDQYFVEHVDPEKHVVISAGAGTGKTHTMISRISYVCYMQRVLLANMADRIVMITFTNDAADQMAARLKNHFRNLFLLTGRTDCLGIISRVENMQISTIHSYAKQLVTRLGTEFGYGIQLAITSSQYQRKRKASDILEAYIERKTVEQGPGYVASLGLPVYAIRDCILEFIEKLRNKSVNVGALDTEQFGHVPPGDYGETLHSLFSQVIPQVEQEYGQELRADNRVHLNMMISMLHKFVMDPANEDRIRKLSSGQRQFLFVDEFQDSDDIQIEIILRLAQLLNFRLFLVGDIKQCIYRFRGAEEQAFEKLPMLQQPGEWTGLLSLRRNYRTDAQLLELFDRSFSAWSDDPDELLFYHRDRDKLVGSHSYNGYLQELPEKFYTNLPIAEENERIPTLIEEIRRLQRRIQYEESRGHSLSPDERSIAILVRDNWQADLIRAECERVGISVQTNTGGDLYRSQPALDMLTLINALLHFDEADYLYSLAISNFFKLDISKAYMHQLRTKIRSGTWRSKADEKEQTRFLIRSMDPLLVHNESDVRKTWAGIIHSLRIMPALQVIRELYNTLKPWRKYSADSWEQHYYQLNVDLLFEQMMLACNIDKLTINTLQEHLHINIVSKQSVDSRLPSSAGVEAPIRCVTVHKAKGLEYGHVILPFCSAPIDYITKTRLHVSTQTPDGEGTRIGYSFQADKSAPLLRNDVYDESAELEEKAREEVRILYVAMTRAIRSFSWISLSGKNNRSWQSLIRTEAREYAV